MNNDAVTLEDMLTWLERAKTGQMSTERAIETAIAIHLAAAGAIERYKQVQDDCKGLLGEIMVETGQTDYKTSAGMCYVTKASKSVTYDTKGLAEAAEKDKFFAAMLEPFRRVTERAGALTIRALKG